MTEYLRINNDFGTTLIDDSYNNMVLIAKGTAVSTGAAGMNSVVTVEYPLNGLSPPMIAIYHTGFIQLWRATNNGTTMSWTFMLEGPISGQVVEYFLFRGSTEFEPPGTGLLVIRNAQNRVIYDSDANYITVRDFVVTPYNQPLTRNYPSGRKYAIAVCQPMTRTSNGGAPGGWASVFPYGAKVSGGLGIFQEWVYRSTIYDSSVIPTGGNTIASFLVLDVTGF